MIIKPGYAGICFELPDDTIIADIGFGHDPIQGATYYIDQDLGISPHRAGRAAAYIPTEKYIQADITKGIPLKDKSCDFIVASNIIEHLEDPLTFAEELKRVSNNGYIETPGIIQEFCINQKIHLWYVSKIGNRLIFIRKPGFIRNREWKAPLSFFPFKILLYLFRQTCYHWKQDIHITIIDYTQMRTLQEGML